VRLRRRTRWSFVVVGALRISRRGEKMGEHDFNAI
jgi:hypothetical protein